MKGYDLQLALHNPEKVTELYLHNKKLEIDGFNGKKITQFVNRKVNS